MKELNSNTTLTQTAQSKDTVVSLEEIYIVSDIQRFVIIWSLQQLNSYNINNNIQQCESLLKAII